MRMTAEMLQLRQDSLAAFTTVRNLHTLADSYETYTSLLEERREAAGRVICRVDGWRLATAEELFLEVASQPSDELTLVSRITTLAARLNPIEGAALSAYAGFDDKLFERLRPASLKAFAEAEGDSREDLDRKRELAGQVICLKDGSYFTVARLEAKLASETGGNSCIPETYEYNFACKVLEAMQGLDETEAAALSAYTGVTAENLGEMYSGMREAVSDAYNELYGEPDEERYTDGHTIYCGGRPIVHGNLTVTCNGCSDFWESRTVSGPAEEVRARVAEFLASYDNPGYWGRVESENEPAPGTLEISLGRRAVCD